MKRAIAILLAFVMLLSLVACAAPASAPEGTQPPAPEVTDALESPPAPTTEPEPEKSAYPPADEYERAIWYGFATAQADENRDTTQREFADMLTALVTAYRPEGVSEFTGVPLVQKATDSPIYRFHAAALLLYAAEAMDCVTLLDGGHTLENNLAPGEKMDWDTYFAIYWDEMGLDPEDFSEISEELTEVWPFGGELDHTIGAIEFAIDHRSRANGLSLLDVDNTEYMRNNDILTYREAAVAVVRLYESNIEVAAQLPEDAEAAAVAEEVLAEAKARRDAILNSVTEVEYTGTAYYISNSGDDSADGLTPETAWATIARLNEAKLQSGDAIFFRRGDTWRGETIDTRRGITYSAYGEGAKPRLMGSPENGAGAEKWTLLPGTDNIWVYHRDMLDCGAVVFNESKAALKVLGYWKGTQYLNYLGPDNQTIGDLFTLEMQLAERPFDVKEQLDRDLTFFSEASSALPNTTTCFIGGSAAEEQLMLVSDGPLYLRCDAGNPGEVYDSIEFVSATFIIDALAEGCTVDNLFIGYALSGKEMRDDTTAQNCEIAWMGGCVYSYSYEGAYANPPGVLRMGGGAGTGFSNVVMRNNYLHELYEEMGGVELIRGQRGTGDANCENVQMSGNVVYHAGGGLCYINWDGEADPNHMFKNVVFEDNYFLSMGLHDWSSYNASCAVGIDGGPNLQEGCAFRNNVFMGSRDCLIFIQQLHPDTLPDFEGNRYLQYNGYPYLWLNEAQTKYRADEAETVVRDILGDDTGTITTLYSMRWDKAFMD